MERRVLIVDDDPLMLKLLERHLASGGYEVLSAANGAEALQTIMSHGPSIVITDWMMPEMDGLELCRRIRSTDELGFVYIIVLTAHTERSYLVEAFEAGADDFVSKPPHREELLARLNAGVRILKLESDLTKERLAVSQANAELTALNRKLERLATTDVLTGLANRREAMRQLTHHWSVAKRHDRPLSCIMLDIDHFKSFNDTYGHDIGDAVLRETAKVIKQSARAGEPVCRFGGEEFLILCPETDASMAAEGAERLRQAIESNLIRYRDLELKVTVSAGVTERSQACHTPDHLLKHADDAMYQAKRAGRNKVCTTTPLALSGAAQPNAYCIVNPSRIE